MGTLPVSNNKVLNAVIIFNLKKKIGKIFAIILATIFIKSLCQWFLGGEETS